MQYNLGQNFFSYFALAIILAAFLSGNRMRHRKEPMDGICGKVINEVFRQIKAGKVTINISVEFCRAGSKHFPSMKPLFQ